MAQPFTLKFVADLGDFIAQVKIAADGVGEVVQVVGDVATAAAPVAEALNAVSTAATENAAVIAELAAATTEAASAQSAEAAELTRLTELLGSEAAARGSMNARIIDNTVAQESSTTATAAAATQAQAASTSTKAYNDELTRSAAAFLVGGEAAERAAAEIREVLPAFTAVQQAALRMQQATKEGLAAFSGKTQELGSLLTALGLVDPQLLRVGVGVQMLGQAAESLAPQIVEAGGGVSGFAAALGPIVGIGAAVAGVLGSLALAAEGVHAAFAAALPEQEFETTFAILLGNVQNAKERLEELDQVALRFHLNPNEVRAASENLTRLSQGALGSGQSLETVIEMSARTGKSLSEMGSLYGRLYEVINSGEPIGRMSTQLVRAGVISASTANQLANLQKEGASGAQVWAALEAALNQYSGAAAAKAQTFQGEARGIRAAWDLMLEGFGRPIVDALTPYAAKVGNVLAGMVRLAQEAGQVLGVVVSSGDGLAALAAILTGNFGTAFTLIAGIMARTSTLVQASGAVIVAEIRSVFDEVVAYLDGIAATVLSTLVKTFGKALAAVDNFAAQMAQKLSFLPGAVRGGITGALGGGNQTGADLTSGLVGGIQGVADASRKTADQAQADAATARKAWDDVLKNNQPAAPNASTQFTPVSPGQIVQPDGKAAKGVSDRTKAVDEGKTAEKEYKDALEATKGMLEAGELSQSAATDRDIQTTQDYIARLKTLQATLDPTSEKYQHMTAQINLAQGSLLKLSERQEEFQNKLDLTKSKLEAGIITQAQADAENNASITAQIALLQGQQEQVGKTSAAYQKLEIEINKLSAQRQQTTALGQITSQFRQVINAWGDLGKNASEWLSTSMNNGISAVSSGITGLITKTGNWRQTFVSAVDSMLGSLVELGIKTVAHYALMGVMMLAHKALGTTTTQATVAEQQSAGAAIATAHAPAAAATSISSYGVAAIVGSVLAIAAIGAIIALLAGGFAEGGLIPGSPSHSDNRIAHVATGEYVVRTAAVQHYGAGLLHAINSMQFPLAMPAYAAGGLVGGGAVLAMMGGSGGGARTPDVNVGGARVTLIQPNTRAAMHEAMRSAEGDAIILDVVQRKKHLLPFKRR